MRICRPEFSNKRCDMPSRQRRKNQPPIAPLRLRHVFQGDVTTKRYRVRWNVLGRNCHGTWPRDYDFKANWDGWISDHFIMGGGGRCGTGNRVSWNLKTNEAKVETLDGQPVDLATARRFAQFAKGNIFPGIDLASIR